MWLMGQALKVCNERLQVAPAHVPNVSRAAGVRVGCDMELACQRHVLAERIPLLQDTRGSCSTQFNAVVHD